MEEKTKAYVICSRTLKELQDAVQDLDRYVATTVCEYIIDRSDISPEQQQIQNQNRNSWYKAHTQDFRVRNEQIYSLVKELAMKKILGGCKKNVKKEIYNEVYNTDIRIIATIKQHEKYCSIESFVEFGNKNEWGNDNTERYEYLYDLDEFREKLKDVKYNNSFSAPDEYILLEKIEINVRAYQFLDIDKTIEKQINKFIKEELTYCLKNDEVIVPQEYIDKGEEGIKEWREIKASKNKNNSIEKKILREAVHNKKKYAYDSMCRIMDAIPKGNLNWAIPFITIDGRWNKQRTRKLVNKVIDNKSQQYYIDTTEEEIMNKFKEYWKDILMTAYNNVDKLPVKEEENER